MTILIVPGLGGSGPEHWQTLWQQELPDARRVELGHWDHPDREVWLAALGAAVSALGEDAVLVAHSLSCALVAHWAAAGGRVRAALLVAPADVDSAEHTPPETWVFRPMPTGPLPFPAMVVASRDDPYVAFARARFFADAWGAAFRDVGARGHINGESGVGAWPEGQALLRELLEPEL
jgi:predicted alpha/beta hydrolase family esterase